MANFINVGFDVQNLLMKTVRINSKYYHGDIVERVNGNGLTFPFVSRRHAKMFEKMHSMIFTEIKLMYHIKVDVNKNVVYGSEDYTKLNLHVKHPQWFSDLFSYLSWCSPSYGKSQHSEIMDYMVDIGYRKNEIQY